MPNSTITEILEQFKNDPKTTKLTKINKLVHVAVLVHRGKIIAEATNRIGYRSKCNKTYYNTFIRDKRNIHAEENVVRVLGDYNKLRGADMYVMKYGRGENDNEFVNSKPCEKCECFLNKCIQKYGLRHVYYTSSNETILHPSLV
jgi:hypothetical protein